MLANVLYVLSKLSSIEYLNKAIVFFISITVLSFISSVSTTYVMGSEYVVDNILKVGTILSYFCFFYILKKYVFVKRAYRLNLVFFVGSIFACGYTLIILLHMLSFFTPLSGPLASLHYHGIAKLGRINLFDGCNGSAVNSALLLFIFLSIWLWGHDELSAALKRINLYYIIIFSAALYLSYSRMSYIAFIVAAFYCSRFRWPRKKTHWIFACSASIFFLLIYALDSRLQSRFVLSSILPGGGSSYGERLHIWSAAWSYITSHMAIKEFIVGMGPNNFSNYIHDLTTHYSTSENQYLLEFVEKGILGLFSYVALIFSFMYLGYKSYCSSYVSRVAKGLSLALFAGMFFMLLHNFAASQFRSSAPFIIVMLAAYLVRELKDARPKEDTLTPSKK